MIGQVIDKYEVLQKLGEGATATVYRGRHLTIGKDVAIKVLHPHLSASTRNRERFNREARAVGRLSHQNIVSILDYSGQTADDCYIVTELVDGLTLHAMIEEHGRIPSEVAAMIGVELAEALSFAHTQGVIHRDLKPENVMIRRDGRVKLMDFGVARVLDEGHITLDGSLLGSPAYMSPQQALDEVLDGRSDLFSLGTVLFHAVTGTVPFAGTNATVILRNIIEGARPEVLELNPQVSPSLVAVIDRLLQPRAEDRYPTAEVAREALLGSLAEVGLTPEHPTINVHAFVATPGDCEAALDAWLRVKLLENGRARLAAKDPLGALQLLNRLLAIDEENAEVIALVHSLHQAPGERSRFRWVPLVGAVALVGLCTVAWWWVEQRPALVDSPAVNPADPAPTSDATVAPVDPDPTVSAEPLPAPSVASPTPATLKPVAVRPPPASAAVPPTTPAAALTSTSTPAPTTPPVTTPAPVSPAHVQLTGAVTEDVLVDGQRLGAYRSGRADDWVGTAKNPISLAPGFHTFEFRNSAAEPEIVRVNVAEGETKRLTIEYRRKPVTFLVKSELPMSCKVSVDTVAYDIVREFPIRDPQPDSTITFDCPAPWGRFSEKVGPTVAGERRFIPVNLPAVRP